MDSQLENGYKITAISLNLKLILKDIYFIDCMSWSLYKEILFMS